MRQRLHGGRIEENQKLEIKKQNDKAKCKNLDEQNGFGSYCVMRIAYCALRRLSRTYIDGTELEKKNTD